jgi:hypothetical protein
MMSVTSKPFTLSNAECRYAECRYAECRYAKCHYAEYRSTQKTIKRVFKYLLH